MKALEMGSLLPAGRSLKNIVHCVYQGTDMVSDNTQAFYGVRKKQGCEDPESASKEQGRVSA